MKFRVGDKEVEVPAFVEDTPEMRQAAVWRYATRWITPRRMTSRDGHPSEFTVEFDDGETWEVKMTSFKGTREEIGKPLCVEELGLRIHKTQKAT